MARLLGLAALFLLAGCLGAGTPSGPVGSAAETPNPSGDAAADVGTLEVTIVTTELIPVPGAQVLLQDTEYAQFSGDDGVARFPALAPGPYTIVAAKPGYDGTYERGRVVDVLAGETTTVQLTMNPVELLKQGSSYHSTFAFRGLISCSYAMGGQSSSSVCGRGLMVAGTTIGDPNDNSTHDFPIDNHLVRRIILEAEWQPSVEALGSQLSIALSAAVSCNAYNYCAPDGQMGSTGGPSPIRYEYPKPGSDTDAGSRFGKSPGDFPATAYTSVHSRCGAGCTVSLTINQSYDAYATAFYGEHPPPAWSVFAQG